MSEDYRTMLEVPESVLMKGWVPKESDLNDQALAEAIALEVQSLSIPERLQAQRFRELSEI